MSDELRDRYRALLRWYPADYRAERGDEIVETYLDPATPGQRRPRAGDAIDLVRGGVRAHLRARDALGLADSLPFAANLALTTATALAALWLILAERFSLPNDMMWHRLGPFVTLGAAAWVAWLLVPAAALLGFGRQAVALALLVTVALIPAAALTSYVRPLFVLVPQVALGVVALAVPARPWSTGTALCLAVTGATAGLAYSRPTECYHSLLGVLPYGGLFLAAVVVVAAVVFSVRRDSRGWWPGLILLGPTLLFVVPLRPTVYHDPNPWPTAAAKTAVVTAAVPTTLWLRGRLRRQPAGGCPTCGR